MTTADQVYCRLWAQWAFNNISILNFISNVFQIFLLLNLFFFNIFILISFNLIFFNKEIKNEKKKGS
jgi:hypothetical protein